MSSSKNNIVDSSNLFKNSSFGVSAGPFLDLSSNTSLNQREVNSVVMSSGKGSKMNAP